jgi:protein TonB
MRRYFSSFLIASLIYSFFGFTIFYFYKNSKVEIEEKKSIQKISLNHIELKEEPKKEDVKELVEEKIIQKPIEEKKVVEKPTEKKIEKPKEQVVKKEIPKKQEEKTTQKEVAKEIVENQPKSEIVENKVVQKDIQKEYIDNNLALIRTLINENINYPAKARKLSIEGIVVVKFKISENGSVEDIVVLEGHRFLQNATIEAIEEASKKFPKTNKSIEIQIPIVYKLI